MGYSAHLSVLTRIFCVGLIGSTERTFFPRNTEFLQIKSPSNPWNSIEFSVPWKLFVVYACVHSYNRFYIDLYITLFCDIPLQLNYFLTLTYWFALHIPQMIPTAVIVMTCLHYWHVLFYYSITSSTLDHSDMDI